MTITRIILIRHGQTAWNQVERFRGQADVPLNETGLAQAEATARRVAAEWQPAAIYSSPLSRAVKTAQAIARRFNLPVQVHPGLADIDYGQWQGLTPDEARERWPELVATWYNTPHMAQIPAGETLDALRSRAIKTVDELVTRHAEETIILLGHTVINRVVLLAMLGLGNERFWHLRQETCAINVIIAQDSDFIIETLNDTCHLRETKP